MRRVVVLLFGTLILLAAAQPAAAAPDPIEGVWAFQGGQVSVKRSGGIFVGRVVRTLRFALCDHAQGERMWTIERVPAGYAGRHQSFDDRIPGCELGGRVWLPSAWNLRGNRLTIRVGRFTDVRPGPCGSTLTVCFTLRRVGPAAASPAALARHAFTVAATGRPASGSATLGSGYAGSVVEGTGGFTTRGQIVLSSSGTITVTHDYEETDDATIRLRVGGTGTYAGSAATVPFTVRASSSPFCFVGEQGKVAIRAGTVTITVCGDTLRFVNGRPSGTAVTATIRAR